MKQFLRFSVAVCLFSWAMFALFYACCHGAIGEHPLLVTAFCSIYMFFPLLVALVFQLVAHESLKSTGLLRFKLSWTWLVAMLLPVVYIALSIVFSGLLPDVSLSFDMMQFLQQSGADSARLDVLAQIPTAAWIVLLLVSGLFAGCTVNALFSMGEEYAWRNYMVSTLRGVPFWKATLLIGSVWGIWHAPLILFAGLNFPAYPVLGVFLMIVLCILMCGVELYLVLKAQSVFPAAVFHGVINALAGTSLIVVHGGHALLVGTLGVCGIVALIVILAFLWLYDCKHERIFYNDLQINGE